MARCRRPSPPIFFGSGYVEQNVWWRQGFTVPVINLIIWLGIGGVWWKIIGFW
ncbi:anion permease [Propionispora sp. 2/2-37]|uniref:anion permease n=1 Tax=Propionispora sp. 2/2-37 TaxID=1677858 RepID=UPI0009E867E9|nr:anion permease [Propionispora sp. 2/2-37]